VLLTLNYNFDDLIGYTAVAMLLAGKCSKVVLSPDISEEKDDFGNRCAAILLSEGYVLSSITWLQVDYTYMYICICICIFVYVYMYM